MKPKTALILTSCCFFAAAVGFLLFAWSLDTPWLIFAIVMLAIALILRKVFPASAKLSRDFDVLTASPKDHEASNSDSKDK
ncbi:hypothetical protein [Allobaculum sp. JKK-2023]|uniref:hypothetical protein n=1 Tax=Allobaculum sp. JKK-2023 TaxID=3108943 RepID=UPI002B0582CD|nr:hypothetical protein [Allobaculum sp. JKK-2023]